MSLESNNANSRITTREKVIRSAAVIAITGAGVFAIKDRDSFAEDNHPNTNPNHELVLDEGVTNVDHNGFLPNKDLEVNQEYSIFDYYLTLQKMIAHPVQGPNPPTEAEIGHELSMGYIKAEDEKEAAEKVRIANEAQIVEEARILALKVQKIPFTPPPTNTEVNASGLSTNSTSDDSIWDKLAECESGGNWGINTGNGFTGGVQDTNETWLAFGGGEFAPEAYLATKGEQIIINKRVLDGQGFGAWPACSSKLGLR